jgi:hypothetical protein
MAEAIRLITSDGTTLVAVGDANVNVIDLKSLVGDWEDGRWGDGKFPGAISVGAISTLRYLAVLSEIPEVKSALSSAADGLSRTLSGQIDSFQRALFSAAKA